MPIRSASFKKRLTDNGQALHHAMASRMATPGADKKPSEDEVALTEERKLLKEQREQSRAKALLPGPTALDRLVRTHHPKAKDKPKTGDKAPAAKDTKEAKKPKADKSRAEKQAVKAAAVEAARRAPKKPAK